MTQYSGQITQLLQGVSQQAEKDRAEGQIGEQVNCISDVVQGLRRRPGTQVLDELSTITTGFTLNSNTAVYSYARGDGTEKYIILVDTSGRVKVLDAVTGAEKTVSYDDETPNKAYLASSNPRKYLRFHTIADTTFALRTTKTVAMDSNPSADVTGEAICYCVQANFGHRYEIFINGTSRAYCTTDSSILVTSGHSNQQTSLSTQEIMQCLLDGTTPASGLVNAGTNLATTLPTGWTFELKDDVLHIVHDNGNDFQIRVEDGNHGNDLKAVIRSVKSFEDLPKYAPDEYPIEVKGTGDEVFDNFWVKWEPIDPSEWAGDGTWQECIAPGVEQSLDPDTMPLQIIRQASGNFLVQAASWVDRAAGDNDTNPEPSFVGYTAQDIGSVQNRLFLLTEENIVMTRAFDRLAWFAESVAAPADDDPIDSASSDNQVTDLLYSLIFNGALVIFSHNSQFIHPKELPIKPADFAVASTTKFNVSPSVRPVTTGNNIIFPTEFGAFTNVWEYNLNTLTGNPECEQNTKHVPKYIAGNPVELIANTTTDYVFMRTDGNGGNDIYVLQFYYKDKERQQLAWHRWNLPNADTIYGMTLINQKLYIILARDGSYFLETIDLSLPTTDTSEFEFFIDHITAKTVTTGEWFLDGQTWTARIAKDPGSSLYIQGANAENEGFILTQYYETSSYIYMKQPAGARIIMGQRFTSSGEFTKPYVRDSQGRPYTKPTTIDEVTFTVENTGYLELVIGNAAGNDYTHVFNGMNLNHWQYKIGVASLLDTDITVPVRNHRELVTLGFESDSHLGFRLMSMDWLAEMVTRGRRSQ